MFRRGFKTWCETVAHQKRRSLKVPSTAPLDPYLLAEDMGVAVIYVEQVPDLAPGTLDQLTKHDPDSWSAVTVCWKNKYLIVMNSAHAKTRQSSSLMHELAHLIIGHKPARLDITPDGLMYLSTYDKTNEEEANWLSGASCFHVTPSCISDVWGLTNEETAALYGCSTSMVLFRINTYRRGPATPARQERKQR